VKKKIVTVIGARPQFVKAAMVSREIRKYYTEILLHTGQHYDLSLSQIFFNELRIPKPDYNLGVGSGSHGWQTGEMLSRIEKILLKEQPDLVLVYGDTNSTLAGALAAVKMHIPIAHVEAGMRSFNRNMPEEINRVLTDHCSDILFCSTGSAATNLENEGIHKHIHTVGDVMCDAVKYYLNIAQNRSEILDKLDLLPGKYLFVTVHRAENTDNEDNMVNIVSSLMRIDRKVVFSVHPRTKKFLHKYGLLKKINKASNILLIDPLGYFDSLVLQKNAAIILTDSGGIQKEAYFLKTPCVTMRGETEWEETIDSGWNVLVGANRRSIVDAVRTFKIPIRHENIYGDGKATEKICKAIRHYI
jgi:UDP-GlcNAc3NAcA epimerase